MEQELIRLIQSNKEKFYRCAYSYVKNREDALDIVHDIDMENGRIITLKDWFGENYRQIVADSIEKTVAGWKQEQRECLWKDLSFAEVVNENTDFYLNEEGSVVVVFPKYEVAIGAAGAMEFVIEAEGINGGIQ